MSALTASSTSDLAIPAHWMAKLMDRLMAQLGGKMSDLYVGLERSDIEREWALDLAGFQPNEIARGIEECSTRRFAPTIGEFKQMCRPALDPEYAWQEAAQGLQARSRGEVGEWSHPAVWRAGSALAFEIRTSNFRANRVRWERELKKEFEKGWGDEVPPVPKLVEHRPTTTTMPAAVRAQLAKLGINPGKNRP